ncbi:hypothetical protein [Streptomyces californicus]|uniref:hypothetical protein n=1 Tax=Streptomyces californicus TaxID=67351 RepID=UPI0004C1F65A|nr:hypothetical protein [Streptomyces californicus]QRV59348.1 hypothetical protein I6J40_34370 [Streptomyces californicus]
MTTQPQTAWPENTVARYLTVGGATVNVTHEPRYSSDTAPNVTAAYCGGCPAYTDSGWSAYAGRWDNGSVGADNAACTWAQKHAETCRAIPKPA